MTIAHPTVRLPSRRSTPHPQRPAGPLLALAAAVAATFAAAAALAASWPREALVPAAAVMLFVLAAAVAALAWLRPTPRRRFDYWDVAGLLTFIAIGVAATVEPAEMIELTAGAQRQP